MKKIMLSLLALLTVSGSLFAQGGNKSGMEWIEEETDGGKKPVIINPNYGGPDYYNDPYILMTPQEQMSIIYGSRYRKAKSRISGGVTLSLLAAPCLGVFSVLCFPNDLPGLGAIGLAGTAACVGAGIALWVKGQREMDWILDDYAKNYGPRPYSSLTFGPTISGGMGLALNF